MSGESRKVTIPDDLCPHHIDYLLAKSENNGGDTLAQHTWDVINRLADQYRLRPNLAQLVEDERIWHRLYWACFLHDFGKAAQGFQDRLKGPKSDNDWSRGQHRHEILSLAFVDWLFPIGHPDRLAIISAVICHHKDAAELFGKYGSGLRTSDQLRRVEFLANQIAPQVVDDLWRWLTEYGTRWQKAVGMPELEAVIPANRERFGVNAVCDALDTFSQHIFDHDDGLLEIRDLLADVHYRGLILTADHAGSAGTPEFPKLGLTKRVAQRPLPEFAKWRSHQWDASKAGEGSALMIAPTGSGKTEAALLWAARQIEQHPSSRLFYTLPYQASMNAMAERLKTRFFDFRDDTENNQVTIQHSRATLKFYQDMMEADSGTNPKAAAVQAKKQKNLAQLNYYPVQVFSPYQMLKAAYSLKGYEALLVDYANGLFIFDEIHAYDPKRLALIITMMGWLARNYRARFLVMTATLPPMIEAALKRALPNCTEITADAKVFEDSQRHIVQILDGDLQDHLDQIAAQGRQGKVLICCNQVARAQEVYRRLQDEFDFTRDNMMLLHGRFNGRDRTAKERRLAEIVGVGKPPRPYVIVATQVVEVSLDIDLDTIYTDPAPLEALLQRFGRVNRGRKTKELCPVHVFRQPIGETESKPYDYPLVEASLKTLDQYCGGGRAIDESLVTKMLGDIYQREEIISQWQKDYDSAERDFQGVLDRMKPFQSADLGTFQEFYRLFEGRQVLPMGDANLYGDALEAGGFLDASQYLVNASEGQHRQMQQAGLVRAYDDYGITHVDVPYSEEWGLDIAGALAAKDEDE